MKVKIGPYPKKSGKRKIKIHIDNYDIWSMDHTLAMIILPMLELIRKDKHGSPYVENMDVPDELKSEIDEMGGDDKVHEKWAWVLDQMIWSFTEILNDNDPNYYIDQKFDGDSYAAYNKKIENGLYLFGKYYRGLWT